MLMTKCNMSLDYDAFTYGSIAPSLPPVIYDRPPSLNRVANNTINKNKYFVASTIRSRTSTIRSQKSVLRSFLGEPYVVSNIETLMPRAERRAFVHGLYVRTNLFEPLTKLVFSSLKLCCLK